MHNETGFKLEKAFIWEPESYNAHRFSLLKNWNGYYVIDPLWCPIEDVDACIKVHTKMFYENPKAKNYRGYVYKTDVFHA